MTEPTVVKVNTGADFLAALPRLTGMTAPESCFIVLFEGSRTLGAARVDLPPLEQLSKPGPELEQWLRQLGAIAAKAESSVIVVQTEAALSSRPEASPHGVITAVIADVFSAAGLSVRDALVMGSDGWASFAGDTDHPELHPLDQVTQSPLHDPSAELLDVEAWRAMHPDKTSEDPEQINSLADQMAAGQSATHPKEKTR